MSKDLLYTGREMPCEEESKVTVRSREGEELDLNWSGALCQVC